MVLYRYSKLAYSETKLLLTNLGGATDEVEPVFHQLRYMIYAPQSKLALLVCYAHQCSHSL